MDYTWKDYTVLIAEDDPLNYRYIELLLEHRTGIQIIWAKDGLEATKTIESQQDVDIVLLDLQLPELDGIQTLKFIRQHKPYLPVIIQTANSWNNEKEICTAAGADGFFTKPLDMDRLLEHMEKSLIMYARKKNQQVNL